MINELKFKELQNQFKDLLDTFEYEFECIRHKFIHETFFYDIIQLTIYHLQVEDRLTDDKINFIISFYSKFLKSDMEHLRTLLNIYPFPWQYKLGYVVPVSFHTSINLDNLIGENILTLKYIDFLSNLFNFLNDSYDDIDFNKAFDSSTFISKLSNLILIYINKHIDLNQRNDNK